MQTNYREINSTAYSLCTSQRVIDVLEHARDKRKQRLRIFYGNTETGLDHCASEAVCGYVGRKSGEIKRPELRARSTSLSGIAINDDEIVKIVDIKTKRVLYRHKNFHQPYIEILRYRDLTHPWRLCFFRPSTGGHFAAYDVVAFAEVPFRTLKEASNRLRFHTGDRMKL